MSKARLGRMHEVMAGYVERGDVPGIVTLVSRRGETHVDAIGLQAVGGRDPMRRDTIFRISSMTKPLTAAATMILVEECKLRLDEPVDRLLPELADRKVLKRLDGPLDETVPANRPITVRDLLTFRLGFGLVMAPPDTYPIQKAEKEVLLGQGPPSPSTPPEPDEWVRRFGTLPLMHQPGEKWMYNTGSDVLGVLIARASAQPLEVFFRERLFEPLGMKDSGFSVPTAKLDRLATSYWTDPGTGALDLHDEPESGQWSRPAGLLRQPRLGVRRVHGHQARGRGGTRRKVRLGRRPGHLLVFGPQRGHGHHPDDPARLDFRQSSACLSRFLDLGLPGDRRLRRPRAVGPHRRSSSM